MWHIQFLPQHRSIWSRIHETSGQTRPPRHRFSLQTWTLSSATFTSPALCSLSFSAWSSKSVGTEMLLCRLSDADRLLRERVTFSFLFSSLSHFSLLLSLCAARGRRKRIRLKVVFVSIFLLRSSYIQLSYLFYIVLFWIFVGLSTYCFLRALSFGCILLLHNMCSHLPWFYDSCLGHFPSIFFCFCC